MPRELRPCGTNAAYLRHIRKGEEVCKPCRAAHQAENRTKWRIAPPEVKARQQTHRANRYEATSRLIEAHEEEFRGLMDDIRAGGHPGGDVRNEAIRRLVAKYRPEFDKHLKTVREWADVFAEFMTKEQG
ncbi:hypothetical protein [Actinocorallia libanotica]|uniref:Uncharacterized protein n=1 Tax=Actinocorallia libanotica TaxID=46162 RepID=A0ABP4AIJ1_9ACTN